MNEGEFRRALAGALAGDKDGFSTLWHSLNPAVLRYLGTAAGDSADDIASETWLAVSQELDRFAGTEGQFRAWLFTIARYRLLGWQRSKRRRAATPVDPVTLADDEDHSDVAEIVVTNDRADAAVRLIAQLAPRQAEVVSLLVLAGLEVRQVAEMTGLQPSTVRVHLHRGLNNLAELVASARQSGRDPDRASATPSRTVRR